MNLPSPENLLSTNEAAKLSGYSADYLARLGKSGKIKATRIGRSWFLDRSSFIAFVGEQGDRREAHARALARVREEEYRKHRSPVRRAVKALTTPVPQATFALPSSFSSHVVSALVAMLVVGCASILAAQIVPGAAEFLATQVAQVRTGLAYLVDDHAQSFRERIAKVQRAQKEQMQRVAHDINALTAELAMPPGTSFDRFAFKLPDEAPRARMLPWRIASERAVSLPHEFPTLADLAVLTPQNVFEAVGASAFALGTYARDFIARSPEVIHRMNLVLGEAAIKATHLAIDADTALAYLVADTAPRSAEFVASVIGESGATLATLTAELPYFATDAFKTSALAFAQTAPRLARGGFALEYALAERFVAFTEIARTYGVGAISSSGALAYEVAAGGAELAAPASSLARLADTVAWSAAEISRGAVTTALEPFAFVADRARDSLAVVVTSIMPETPLGAGERTALSTYRTLHRIFDYTTDALAALFTPRPSVVTPFAIVPSPQAATTHPAVVYSSPTTVVYQTAPTSGLSADFVTNSLAGLRTAILNEVSDMVRPISGQVATNIQTINMVSKVEDLSDLIVRDGDFRKGHFDSPYITNATHIDSLELTVNGSATTTNLYVSGNTNIGGDLAVTGTITPAVIAVTGQSSAGYFTATSSTASTFPYASSTAITALDYLAVGRTATTTIRGDTATSTFSGRLSVGTTTPFGDALFVVGTNSPSLFVKGTDGAVGIGTTSPYAKLSVVGPVVAEYFHATSTTATSTFAGGLTTSSSGLNVLTNGNVGIGTSSPDSQFHVAGTGGVLGKFVYDGSLGSTGGGGLSLQTRDLPTGANQQLGYFTFGSDNAGATQWLGAAISAYSESAWADGVEAPSYLTFSTVPEGSLSVTERVRITSAGSVGIGTTSPYAALSVNGRGVFNQDVSVDYLTATSTSVASTFNLAEITTGTTTNATSTNLVIESLTSGRVPYVTTGGRLIDSANLTFDGTILTAARSTFPHATSSSSFGLTFATPTRLLSLSSLGQATSTDLATWIAGTANQVTVTDDADGTVTLSLPSSLTLTNFTATSGTTTNATSTNLVIESLTSGRVPYVTTGGRLIDSANLTFDGTILTAAQGSLTQATSTSFFASSLLANVFRAGQTGTTTITSTGFLGIGTTSPYAALSVNGRGVFNQDVSVDYLTATSTTATSTFEGGLAVETSGFVYDFSTGKVGIGLANPDSKLTISTTDSVQLKLHRDGNTIGNAANLQLALDDSAGNITNYASIQGTIESPTDGSEDGSLTFNTVLNAALTQRMIILSTGNVGIGTTSPYAALSVNGRGVFNQDISADYFTATSTTLASTFPFASTTMISATTASTTNLVISGITGTQCLRATLGVVSGTGADCGSGGGTPNSKWATSTVDTAAISPSGALRVGIGTTTPQWALQVASTTGPQLALSDLLTTSDRWTFRATSNSFYLATSSPSTFATSTSPVLAIDTNGFVGVATTSPYARLSVAGRVAATAFNADNASATSTFAGGFDVGSGALQYDFSRNVTSIERLDTGALSFETNAGVVSWFDFPVTSSASANTAESYTAQIDSNAVLTVYGESDGSGGVQNLKVGVATTSPWGVLSVEQSTETYSLLVGNSGSSTPAFAVSGVNRNGAVAIATSTANSSFATSSVLLVGSNGVNGAVAVFGGSAGYCSIDPVRTALQCASDISLKYNVNALDGSLDALLALRPVTYNWNIEATSTAPHVGFIAQEVEPLFPDLVTSDNGLLSLNYAGLTPYLTKAVQELAARTNGFVSLYTSTTTQAITLDEAGRVGIGLDTPTHLLDVAGEVAATGFINISTRDAKTDITYLTASSTEEILANIESVKIAQYHYTNEASTNPLRLGLIAEEAPRTLLSIDGKGVDLYKLATFNLAGLQALTSRVAALALHVDSIESRLAALESATSTSAFSTSTLVKAFSDLGIMVEKGFARFGTLIATQFVAATDEGGNSLAGTGAIVKGETIVEVINPLVKPTSKVFVTFTAPLMGSWYLGSIDEGRFRIALTMPQEHDVSFDYFVVGTEAMSSQQATPLEIPASNGVSTSTPETASSTPDTTDISTSTPPAPLDVGELVASDVEPPTVTLEGAAAIELSVGDAWVDPGATAIDATDGDLSAQITVLGAVDMATPGLYTLTYRATDAAGNEAEVSRVVSVVPASEPEPTPEPEPEPEPAPETASSTSAL